MKNGVIPVTIITGFLGAGKTTLVNNLIKKHPEKKFAIIENEFGQIGIDGGLIVGAEENIFELNNGCICCSLNEGFYDTLRMLLESSFFFNHLLVETTGIADPDSIIKAFLSSEGVQAHFRIDSVVCLADAANVEDSMKQQFEVRKQLAVADFVLLNKVDEVQPEYASKLTRLFREVNPMTIIHPVQFAQIDTLQLLDTNSFSGKVIEEKTMSFQNVSFTNRATAIQSTLLNEKASRHDYHSITSEGFIIPGGLNAEKFSLWMQTYLFFNRDTIFRVKGILSFQGKSERLIFQAVRDRYVLESGQSWDTDVRFSKLVFIGRKIDRDSVEDDLYQLLEESEVSRE